MPSTHNLSPAAKRIVFFVLVFLAGLSFGEANRYAATATTAADETAIPANAKIAVSCGKLPLSFEPTHTQADSRVRFVSQGQGYTLFLTSRETVLILNSGVKHRSPEVRLKPTASGAGQNEPLNATVGSSRDAVVSHRVSAVVRMQLVGGNPQPAVRQEDERPGKSNYFIGNDPGRWRTKVPSYGKVRYRNVYPGIDLVYYGSQRRLEHDFVVAPGADPTRIRFRLRGVSKLELDQGDLVMHTAEGELRLLKPEIYQLLEGTRRKVSGRYILQADNNVSFDIGAFDRRRPLVIDPVLSYSTYLGGSSYDYGYGIAVDSNGSVYVTGRTNSTDFPVTTKSSGGGVYSDVFIAKLAADGQSLLYSTYLGGSNNDAGYGIAVDSTGHAYVTGYTSSTDFPTQNAFQSSKPSPASYDSAFVTELSADGSALVYSTYLGGSNSDYGQGIAVDGGGHAYVTGATASTDFPTQNALYGSKGVGYDAFVAKLAADGQSLVYSTYLGGNGDDYASGIAIDSSNNVYLTGATASTDFPTQDAYQSSNNASSSNSSNAFVTQLKADGSALIYSTYLGGNNGDSGQAIAVDSIGNAYITGATASTNFPTQNAYQNKNNGAANQATNAFVTKLAANGQSLVYSTYLGGSNNDWAHGIAVDSNGSAFVTGETSSTDFPTSQNAFQSSKPNAPSHNTSFVTKLAGNGQSLVYSTFLGGSSDNSDDYGYGIALDSSGNAYVTGYTTSPDFPTHSALQSSNGGMDDAFVVKIVEPTTPWLWASPSSLVFTAVVGGNSPAAQPISIADLGTGNLSWTASYTSGWLLLDSTGGTATSGAPASTTYASVKTAGMAAGSYHDTITVTASGVSGSPATIAVSLNIDKVSTTTTLQTSAATVQLRESVTFKATVASNTNGTPTGSVTFMDGSTPLGNATLDASGAAVFTLSTLPLGSHSITAVYSGDTNFAGSTSSAVKVTVNGNTSAVALQTSSTSVLLLNSVTFTAHVTSNGNGTPTGTVSFIDSSTSLGNAILDASGTASFTLSTLSLGSHSITAVYGGDANFAGSSSSPVNETVQDFQVVIGGGSGASGVTVEAGGVATYQLQISPINGTTFPSAVTFGLSSLPPGATCTVAPSVIATGSPAQTVTVEVQTSLLSLTAGLQKPVRGGLVFALGLLPILGVVRLRPFLQSRSKRSALLLLLLVFALSGLCCSCGAPHQAPRNYTMQLTATSGALVHATTLGLTVR
jgi:hypothetical protein